MWIGDKEVLTTALGNSMTSVPANTDMHWRVGGMSELFEGTLLMMLVDEKRSDRGIYEDCTYYNPSWGSVPGILTSNLHDLDKWGPIFGTGKLSNPSLGLP